MVDSDHPRRRETVCKGIGLRGSDVAQGEKGPQGGASGCRPEGCGCAGRYGARASRNRDARKGTRDFASYWIAACGEEVTHAKVGQEKGDQQMSTEPLPWAAPTS